jgi:hypothetical protein
MRKIFTVLTLGLFLVASPSYAVWNAAKPANDGKIKEAPAEIRANWAAIATGTDAVLCVNNAKMCAAAAIGDDKLAQITNPAKVSGAALTLLGSIPSSANGQVPIANGGTGQSTATTAATALLPTQTGNSGKALVTNATVQSWGYPASLTIASAATGDLLYYNGTVWTRIAAGTSGYYLKAAGAGAPVWTDVFNITTGHDHDGADSKKIPVGSISATGTPGITNFLRGDGTWSVAGITDYTAGTYVEVTAATERTQDPDAAYEKMKELTPLMRAGTVTVSFDLFCGDPSGRGRAYINDIAVGTEQAPGGTYTTYTENFTVAVGDVIQVWTKGTSFSTKVKNLIVKTGKPTIPSEVTSY